MSDNLKTSIVEFDSVSAQKWLDKFHFDFQRKPKKWAVDFYASEMREGRFKPYTMIEVAVLDGKRFLVDGQHRLRAIVASGVKLPLVVLETTVRDEAEVASRYAQTDRGIKRTTADQYAALALPEEFGFNQKRTEALGAACNLIRCNFTQQVTRGVSLDEKLALMREYVPFATAFYDTVDDAGVPPEMQKIILRAATLAVAIATYRYSAEKYGLPAVESFWTGVISDNGIGVGDPRKLANRHLLKFALQGGSTKKERVSTFENVKYLALCFNAFVSGEKRTYIRTSGSGGVKILGSPWNG